MNSPEQEPLKVLIVDDHQMFIDGLKTILNRIKTVKVVAEANNGEQALGVLKNNQIDIMITDIGMPGMSGTELTKNVKELYPYIKILVLTMHNEREIIHEIIMSEAEGYVLKNAGRQELVNAIEKISDNGTYYSNEVLSIIAENYIYKEKIKEKTEELTEREIEILKLVCQENTTAEIAEKLFISPLTVETHRKNILRKTKVKTIVGLIKFAIENNLA
jgi:DNA-binding NarL/FixJ family response regulator